MGFSTNESGLFFRNSHLIACVTTADKLTRSRNTLNTDTSVKRCSCHFSKSALLNSSNNTAPKGVFAIRFNRNASDLAPPLLGVTSSTYLSINSAKVILGTGEYSPASIWLSINKAHFVASVLVEKVADLRIPFFAISTLQLSPRFLIVAITNLLLA